MVLYTDDVKHRQCFLVKVNDFTKISKSIIKRAWNNRHEEEFTPFLIFKKRKEKSKTTKRYY